MPIDLNSSVSRVSHMAFGNAALNTILSNSVFVAFVITAVVILIVLIMYPARANTPFFIVGKMFVYIMLISWIVIFLHDSVSQQLTAEQLHANESRDFIQNIVVKDPVYGRYEPIRPTQSEQQEQHARHEQPNQVQQNQVSGDEQRNQHVQHEQPASDIIGGATLYGPRPPMPTKNPYA